MTKTVAATSAAVRTMLDTLGDHSLSFFYTNIYGKDIFFKCTHTHTHTQIEAHTWQA